MVTEPNGVQFHTLRLSPSALSNGGFATRIELYAGDSLIASGESFMAPTLTLDDFEDLRWYLEDFPSFPNGPAASVAQIIEARLIDAGVEMFHALFQQNQAGQLAWSVLGPVLHNTRVEIMLSSPTVDAFPWELMRSTSESPPLAVQVRAFVRRSEGNNPERTGVGHGRIRVLLVICRPDAQLDVPFRSVTGHLLTSPAIANSVEFHVLRPPSFARLSDVLSEAAADRPFDIVHFDGHGIYEDLFGGSEPSPQRRRGYLIFEDANAEDKREPVHGTKLGRELARNKVRLLVMNACRSAHAGIVPSPEMTPNAASLGIRAYGSLADETVRAGVPAVVAMRYNVWVDTAAGFMIEMYQDIAKSASPGESARSARGKLFLDKFRKHAGRFLEDWQVPVIYEQAPIRIRAGAGIDSDSNAVVATGPRLTKALPAPSPIGFAGQDAVILAIDRAYDVLDGVLLTGAAGSGKSALLAEFGRWFAFTGGTQRSVLYTSFRSCRSVADVIQSVIATIADEETFSHLADESKGDALIAYLRDHPSLWLWDDLDHATGSILGHGQAWPQGELRALRSFLEKICGPSRVLLSSRSEEGELVGSYVHHIKIPALSLPDSYELVRRVATFHGATLRNLDAWEPLLEMTRENVLALMAFAECAFDAGADSRESFRSLLDRVSDGLVVPGGKLSYAAVQAIDAEVQNALSVFSPKDQKRLVLLALFRNFFTETTFRYLGRSDCPWGLSELGDISAVDLLSLLSRFADTSLLLPLPGGYFVPHPLLSVLLRPHLNEWYAAEPRRPLRAFVDVMGTMCKYMVHQYNRGEKVWRDALIHERPGVFYAFHLAVDNQWWDVVVSIMQGIRLSARDGYMNPDWPGMVNRVAPNFIDIEGMPMKGREEDWVLIMDYLVEVSNARNDDAQTEAFEKDRIKWLRNLISQARSNADVEHTVYYQQWLARSLRSYGRFLSARDESRCLPTYQEAFEIMVRLRMNDAGICARDIAIAYGSGESYADPEKCEKWIGRTIKLIPDDEETMALLAALRSSLSSHQALEEFDARKMGREQPSAPNQAMADDLIGPMMSLQKMMADELPLPPRRDPRARVHALRSRGEARFARRDERAVNDLVEALQIAGDLNDILLCADIGIDLATWLLHRGRGGHARPYTQAALDQYLRAGDRGRSGAVKARELLAELDEKSNLRG